jgi:ribonuclease BN (tRNA processing enzyme)
MKIDVLGCSGAKFPGHNTPTFMLGKEILFDAGTIAEVLNEKQQLKIKYIFITHAHLDHIRSIPFLADNIIVGQNEHRVTIFSIASIINTIKKHLFNSSVWPDFSLIPDPENAVLNFMPLKVGRPLTLNGYSITPYKVPHTVPAVGYLIQDRKSRRVFYTGDMGPSGDTWKKLGDVRIDCLIIDVSFPNSLEGMAVKTGHLTPGLLQHEILKMSNPPGSVCIAHIKPQYSKKIKEELRKLKIRNLSVLKDGDTIRV